MNVDEAYRACQQITRAEARNFNYGIKLLPEPKRKAMSALYAMARRIDDIGDGDAPEPEKLAALARVRKDLATLDDTTDAVLVAVAETRRRYPIPMSALEELIDGCEMDVHGAEYTTFDDLVGYCRRVAGTVGRLSLSVYGCAEPERAAPLADDLGVALQITNILRDVVEDRRDLGRVYLPAEDRDRFGVADDLTGNPDNLLALIAFEAGRAEEWYERGLQLLPMLDWRSRACTAAMAGIYRRLLVEIQRDPAAVLRRRMSLPPWQKVGVALRAVSAGSA
ncbi:MAG TPA: presqualene diphosphate synthase HpnD [Acidimicrobiales bacterium]|nr:presqualene diphosphate synthase HpnD [Acidimicrobiales bacterium]